MQIASSDQRVNAAPESRSRSALSSKLWRIDWSELLPQKFNNGLQVVWSSYEEAQSFVIEHYRKIFHEEAGSPFFASSSDSSARAQYCRSVCDFFEFKDGERTCGVFIGEPTDWSSYYIRSTAVLPDYEGAKLPQMFLVKLCEWLKKAGVERVSLETSPGNLGVVHHASRLNFNVTGSLLSERWGALTRFTKFLAEPQETVFLQQFCSGVKYQRARGVKKQ